MYDEITNPFPNFSGALAIVKGMYRWPVDSPHKGPATRKMFPFDDVIMLTDATIGSYSVFGDSSDESYIRFTEMLYIIPSGHHSNNDNKEYKIKSFSVTAQQD